MSQPSVLRMLVIHALLALATMATLFPVLWVVKMALAPGSGMAGSANPLPTMFSLDNFAAVLGTRTSDGSWLFGRQVLNSLVVSSVTAVLGTTLACTAGYALSRWAFPGRERLGALMLLT